MKSGKRPLQLGFIGGGLSSAVGQVHFSASRMDGLWELAAGAFSRNGLTNAATAKQWGVAESRVYDDWRELILQEKSRLDAVAVLLPTPLHAEAVEKLLKYDIPVICEKSLVAERRELPGIARAMKPSKSYLAVTYNYSGYPLVRELRELIRSGELGRIKQFHFEMPQEGFVRPPKIAGKNAPPQSWRLQNSEIPMVCHDLGMHLHHLSEFLFAEEAEAVMAEFSSYSPYHKLVDTVFMWLRYHSGMKGNFWFTKSALGNRNGMRVRIYGDKASAEWLQMRPEELRIARQNGRVEILDRGAELEVADALRYNRMKPGHPAGFVEAFANLYADIHGEIAGNTTSDFVYGFEHACAGMHLFAAAVESDRDKAWKACDTASASFSSNSHTFGL